MGRRLLIACEAATLAVGIILGCSLALADGAADRQKLVADLEASQRDQIDALKAELKEQK